MVEFYKYLCLTPDGEPARITIATGPVIIKNKKVLVVKHGDDAGWKFPGGRLRDDCSAQENAKREVKEELGLDVSIEGEPFVVTFTREKDGVQEYVILMHYRATILNGGRPKKARDVREVAWLPINELPDDCMPNIKPAVRALSEI
ncbi:MAG: NUDIX hydrolase [Candidatus Magasanikbacteria bacterium]|nr:NUDIX hydrolase [Candidatus Magasanikbacteria bacterium]